LPKARHWPSAKQPNNSSQRACQQANGQHGFEGNRPSSTILAEKLDPYTLGALVALYEHSVFVQGAIWDIDSFDQWCVELGKTLASRMASEIDATQDTKLARDSSTNTLIRRYRRIRGLPS
jgi:glucose-6-phosphate isomerase